MARMWHIAVPGTVQEEVATEVEPTRVQDIPKVGNSASVQVNAFEFAYCRLVKMTLCCPDDDCVVSLKDRINLYSFFNMERGILYICTRLDVS